MNLSHLQLFVFTDGQVSNTSSVLDEVKRNSDSHRCFSFGIGDVASTFLINGMAMEGRGHAQFITGTERMQPKVMQSLRFALQPLVADISVTWDLPEGVSATILSPPITAIFQGQKLSIFARLTGKSQSCQETEVGFTLNYTVAGHPSQNRLNFSLHPAEDTIQNTSLDQKDAPSTGFPIHRLAARNLIRSLEMMITRDANEYEERRQKIIELSIHSGVSSVFTTFIAVNKSDGRAVQGPLIYRENPSYMHPLRGGLLDYLLADLSSKKNIFSRIFSSLRKRTSAKNNGCFVKKKTLSDAESKKVPRDPLLQLISLQEASGSWKLNPALAAALGKTTEEVAETKPASAKKEVWATILALIWLHGFQMVAKEEWELLAMKATSRLISKKAVCLRDCVEAGNLLLGCNVQHDALGL